VSVAVIFLGDERRPLALSSALEDLGKARVRAGAVEGAITAFDRSLSINTRVGAIWDAARVRGRLRTLGLRRRVTRLAHPATGWDALTATELRVAQLASHGRTNKEIAEKLFISPHTVSAHLRHIFEKLGIT
jgi:DNA-binding CsgD family transcriptional regulator